MTKELKTVFLWSFLGCLLGVVAVFTGREINLPYSAIGIFSGELGVAVTVLLYGYLQAKKDMFILGLWMVFIFSFVCAMKHFNYILPVVDTTGTVLIGAISVICITIIVVVMAEEFEEVE